MLKIKEGGVQNRKGRGKVMGGVNVWGVVNLMGGVKYEKEQKCKGTIENERGRWSAKLEGGAIGNGRVKC